MLNNLCIQINGLFLFLQQEMYATQAPMPMAVQAPPQQAVMPTYGNYSNTLGFSYPTYMQQGMYR